MLTALSPETEVIPHFPTLTSHPSYIFADNAGGSAVIASSIAALSTYLIHTNVQLGGSYPFSVKAGEAVGRGTEATAKLVNVDGGGKQVVFGSSTTQLASNLGYACETAGLGDGVFVEGDEIVLSAADHEANVGPWTRLASALGLSIKYWLPTPLNDSPFSLGLQTSTLSPLLSHRTRLVAFTATSNLLGHFTDVKEVTSIVKEKTGGRGITVVDCVAYAPHGRIDMKDWGCDAVLFSYYKLFAPHLSCLVLSPSSPLSTLTVTLGHYFHPRSPAYKLAPGGAPYELQVACAEILPYFLKLGGGENATSSEEEQKALNIAFERIQAYEKRLSERLLGYLLSEEAAAKGVRIVGPTSAEGRAPTVSFLVVKKLSDGVWEKTTMSRDIVKAVEETGEIGIKYGHFYATRVYPLLPIEQDGEDIPSRVIEGEGCAPWRPTPDEDAVVRISLVHYNTLEQVDRIIDALKKAIT